MTPITPDVINERIREAHRLAVDQGTGAPGTRRARRAAMHFANELDIDRPIGEVFDFLADATNVPLWNYYVTNVVRVDSGPLGAGATFDQTRRNDRQLYRIDVYDRPRRLVLQTLPDQQPTFRRTLQLDPTSISTTHVTDSWQLDLGLPALIRRPATRNVASAVADNLHHLKKLLETGRTRLQDGTTHTAPVTGSRPGT